MEHRFYTLDVFTNSRFEGNPLAVFTDGDSLSNDQMLAIAREMNLAETVFVQKPTDERALARLRIFTTREELKLAGHPVIGTWFLLAELGVVPAQEGGVHIMQETGAGVFPVEIRFKDGRPQRVTMTQTEAAFRPIEIQKSRSAKALGPQRRKIFDPHLEPECVSTGIFNLMVPLKNRAALGKISMNMFELRKLLGKNATMAYCFALRRQQQSLLARHAALGNLRGSRHRLRRRLARRVSGRHGKLAPGHTLSILQGEEMGRPSHIEVEVTQSGKKLVPRVSGAAVKVFEGTITSKPHGTRPAGRARATAWAEPIHLDRSQSMLIYFARDAFVDGVQDAVHKRSRIFRGKFLRQIDGFVQDHLWRRVRGPQLVNRQPQDRAVDNGKPLQPPILRLLDDQFVDRRRILARPLRITDSQTPAWSPSAFAARQNLASSFAGSCSLMSH